MKLTSYWLLYTWGTMVLFTISCIGKSNPSEKIGKESKPLAQVIQKTQDFPFDLANKNLVKGDYVDRQYLIVPPNLAPQNKWVMFEGPVLENDLIAYRFYMDSRTRSDIFGKKTKALVMDTVGWNYHDIVDWGADILKVGESLGIGSPAIWYNDSLYTLSNYSTKSVEIVQQKGDVASVKFTFEDLVIGNSAITLTQLWSLGIGKPHSTIELEVIKGKLPEGAKFATGIVKHLEAADSGVEKGKFYLFTWGKQSIHEQNMGMGIVVDPEFEPSIQAHLLNHLVVFNDISGRVSYQFVAAWENDVMEINKREMFKDELLR